MPKATLRLSEDQVLYFRAHRSHLAGPGAPDATAAAAALLGAQAQQPGPGLLALCQRTAGRPSAKELKTLLREPGPSGRRLVHAWGQRETLHFLDPADWPVVVAARGEWAPGGRPGPLPNPRTLDKAQRLVEEKGLVTRSDLIGLAPRSHARDFAAALGPYFTAEAMPRLIAGRLLWCLSMRGDACVAGTSGRERSYAARSAWFPDLAWPQPEAPRAARALVRRYLAMAGPASVQDIAHFFGARVRQARTWIDSLRKSRALIEARSGEREGLLALAKDEKELRRRPPTEASRWPARLLPQWDTHLMCHADKSWTVPEAAVRKLIWRRQGVVAAVVLHRGRVVAQWQQELQQGRLRVNVLPLAGWRAALLPAVKRETAVLARHLDREPGGVTVGPR